MAVSGSFREFVAEQLAVVGPVTVRAMFGGAGVYLGGRMFALIAFETLYLKADDSTKHRYEAEGLKPFTYDGQTGPVSMSYWRAPERLLDDGDEMLEWAKQSVAAARSGAAKKKTPASKKPASKKSRRKP